MSKVRQRIELVDVADLEPAAYNPRQASKERLEYLRLSLRKLGFILPIYATKDGHLLSGHQRLGVAIAEGYTKVPVVRLEVAERNYRQVNLLFNRITNDMNPEDSSTDLFARLGLASGDLQALCDSIPDKKPNTPESYPCMNVEYVQPVAILEHEPRKFRDGSVEMCRKAHQHKIFMPVVVTESGKIVNGVYRAMSAAVSKYAEWGRIVIPDKDGELAELLTNLVTMNFTVEKQYADVLRMGSFRRTINVVENLVRVMRFFADGCVSKSAEASLEHPQRFWANFRRIHGERVLDFGAGQCRNGLILRKKGIDCTDWEPYPVPWNKEDAENKAKPCLNYSRELTDAYLKLVANRHNWTSIFMNAVLNSVPFHKDRMAALAVVHASCSFNTVLYGTAAGLEKIRTERIKPLVSEDGKARTTETLFKLDYEANVTIADIAVTPKVQKYHTEEELREMLERFWNKVTLWPRVGGGYWAYKCEHPKRVNPVALVQALLHEFNLPHEAGRMDRHMQAAEAFGKRHGLDLIPLMKKAVQEANKDE